MVRQGKRSKQTFSHAGAGPAARPCEVLLGHLAAETARWLALLRSAGAVPQ